MARGKFIVIEGGEGVGKTTQMNLLKETLPAKFPDREFVFTKEPGGTPTALKIRALIIELMKEADGRAMLGLFMAARFEHVDRVVRPALEENKIVISDRYVAASYVYQMLAQHCPDLLPLFDAHKALIPIPNMTIVLDLAPQKALERLTKRDARELSNFDGREIAFHESLRTGYREYAKRYPNENILFIDGDSGIELIHKQILEAITNVLK